MSTTAVDPVRRLAAVRRTAAKLAVLVLCLLPACQQKMAVQPSVRPDEPSKFFPDGRAARPVIAGTIARGHLKTDLHLFTGLRARSTRAWAVPVAAVGAGPWALLAAQPPVAGNYEDFVDTFPFPVTAEVLQHGQDRFMIYCVVCHDVLGTGKGKIVERGYTPPPSYHSERLRKVPVGHIYQVITRGYGSMPGYAEQVPPRDRWAIAAYIRALQLSQHFPEADLSPEMRQEWANMGGSTKTPRRAQ